jgi:CRP-like cAMP-binding protein
LQESRAGLEVSPYLESQLQGLVDPDRQEFPAIATAELFADLLPEDILWVARQGHLRDLEAGTVAMAQGGISDFLALVLAGEVRLRSRDDREVVLGPGQTVGEMGVITGERRSVTVSAGPAGARVFVLPAQSFEELLRRSRRFGRGLLAQLAERLAAQGR